MIEVRRLSLFTLLLATLSTVPSAAARAAPVLPAAADWSTDVAAARARAEREEKPILVDLWAAWCTWCKRLDEDVFSTAEFRDYALGFVLLRVDTEDGADGTRLMEDFAVESLPTTLLVTHDLIRIGELRGYAPVGPFVQSLQLEAAMYATLLRAYDDRGKTGGDALQTLADELHARRDGRRAAALYRELLARGDANAEEEAWNRFYYADSLRLARVWTEARAAAAEARAAAGALDNGELRERVDLLPYYLARDAAACEEARAALERFVAEHPDGIYVDVAQHALRRMKSSERCA